MTRNATIVTRAGTDMGAATAGLLATHGYWLSDDIGSMDADAFLRVFDRTKDMLNHGGFMIYLLEVENVVSDLLGVIEAATVGRPCPVLGGRMEAIVVYGSPDVAVNAVRSFCADLLSGYKGAGVRDHQA